MFRKKFQKMKVLFVAAEAAPYAQVGGLGEVMHSLPRALREMGVDARIFIPKYGKISQDSYPAKVIVKEMHVPTDDEKTPFLVCNIKEFIPEDDANPPVYFLENMEYYEQRANEYGYIDDSTRFALLSRGAIEFLRNYRKWTPDVINCLDWETGFCVDYLKKNYKNDPTFNDVGVVFSIHNLYHQGSTDYHFVPETERDNGEGILPSILSEAISKINGAKRGILGADFINTVSPEYAKEIITEEYGEGLNDILKERQQKIFGILNGLDYEKWDPETDELLVKNFSVHSIENRKTNKRAIQERFNLPRDPKAPLLFMVTRLDPQKGVDLVIDTLEPIIDNTNTQFVIIGGGNNQYREQLEALKEKFPQNVGLYLFPDFSLPHLLFGGGDIFLMPSRFEPCGVTQMQAMRYGAVPIVRATGGLADTVTNYDPESKKGSGFVFKDFDKWELFRQVTRAIEEYRDSEDWVELQRHVMSLDFSWKQSAKEYLALYKQAILAKKA